MKMTRALVLLTLEPDVGRDPVEEIKRLTGVINSEILYGPYDAYALIEADNSGNLQEIVIEKIRNIEGIEATLTCFIA